MQSIGVGGTVEASELNFDDQLYIDTVNNRVGIGTTGPDYPLSLESNGALFAQRILNSHADGEGMLIRATDGSSSSKRLFQLADKDDNKKVTFLASGNVGIGTTVPGQKLSLELSDTGTTQSAFKGILLSNSDTTVNNGAAISFSHTAASGNSHTKIGAIYEDRTGSSEDTSLFFGTLGGGAYGERMRITSNGNVGIGTTSPTQKLDVDGEIKSDGLRLDLSATTQRAVTSTGTDSIQIGDSGVNDIKFKNASAVSVLDIKSSGNVGIGTESPSAKLDVTSTTSGFLPPRMTTTQRDAISTPATGLVIYNTTTNVLNFYNSTSWGAV